MQTISGFPYFELEFTKEGEIHKTAEAKAILNELAGLQLDDLLIMSHGWNNDMDEARDLYRQMLAQIKTVMGKQSFPRLQGRQIGILGILWPSKKFADKELIAGGAANLGQAELDDKDLLDQLDELSDFLDDPNANDIIAKSKALVPNLEDEIAASDFADLIRQLLPPSDIDQADEVPQSFYSLEGAELIKRLGQQDLLIPTGPGGGAAGMGGAASGGHFFGQLFGSIKGGARNLLNFVTYYKMKNRAGVIAKGLNPFLKDIRDQYPDLGFHLLGHSFGARLVTATAAGQHNLGINSMTLLQAAFSHNGFAENYQGQKNGFFRNIISENRISGPILISHTANDPAVGIAYPIASRIAKQADSGLGDKDDVYGGMGRNGAQWTPEAVDGVMQKVGGPYVFEKGKVYNLLADDFIGGHSDIKSGEVAYALLKGMEGV